MSYAHTAVIGRRSVRNSTELNRIGPEFESGERPKGVKSEQCLGFIIEESNSAGRKKSRVRIIWGETVLYLLALKYKCLTQEWELESWEKLAL